jgi:hypothetical protein
MRKAIWALIAAATITLGLAVSVPAAHAETNDGICETGSGTGVCWRADPSGGTPIHAWNRDISGDVNQQFTKSYIGVATNTPWIANCLSDLARFNPNEYNSIKSIGVYKFYTDVNYPVGTSGNQVAADESGGFSCYDAYAWFGGGQLVDLGQTDYYNGYVFICSEPNGARYIVSGTCPTDATFTSIHV